MFYYERGSKDRRIKIETEEKNDKWETRIFVNNKLYTKIKNNESLLNSAHQRKIEQAIKDFIPIAEERLDFLLDLSDAFNKGANKLEKMIISLEALDILSVDPMGFILNELEKVHPGDKFGLKLYTLSTMSLNPAVGYYVHIQTVGKSGGGKTHGQKVCKKLLPSGMQHSVDSMSTKSLIYYAKDNSLKNKLVIIDDASERDIDMLKQVGNNGLEPFTYSTVIDGNYVEIKADASPLIWFSKVRLLNDEGGQVASRFLVYNIDESTEQRLKILDNIKNDTKASISPLCVEITNECINLDIKDIDAGDFKFPYPETIGYRDANFFKALIKCSALLNHMNREIQNGVLYATEEDAKIVEELWAEISRYNRHKLSEKEAKIYDLIPDDIEGISATELRNLSGEPKTTVYRTLDNLESKGLIIRQIVNNRSYFYRNF
jgi:hypothetical protein